MAASPKAPPILVFARTPVPGKVKTRLIPAIGVERAANLHRAMLWRAADTAVAAGLGPVELWCWPSIAHPYLEQLRDQLGVTLHQQSGEDLGERMQRALASACRGARGALLIGSDCPFLETSDLQEAANALAGGADAVIGPAQDGGFYLVGVRISDPRVFSDIAWGSERVLAATRDRLRALGWRWHELATRCDVDRPEDLAALRDLLVF